jgi:hypothetical protein
MSRADLDVHFSKIDELIEEIDGIVPPSSYREIQFRSDLAGLLVVAIAATYETCVKEILFEYANRHHISFGNFAMRNYAKLNSRVQVRDLEKYCKLYDPSLCLKFKTSLSKKKNEILERVGKNIETSYEQILTWRHDFAHARIRNTTIEEAASTHKFGKRILYIFDSALSS